MCLVKVLYVYRLGYCHRLRLNDELPKEKNMIQKYLRSQTFCNNWNGAINVQQCYLTTNLYVFYEVANSILYNLSKKMYG